MFGANRPVRFGEDGKKENIHRQASAPGNGVAPTYRPTPHQQTQDPLCTAEKPERDYVESMDQAFSCQIQEFPASDRSQSNQKATLPGNTVGSKKQKYQNTTPGAVHLDNEFTLHEFQTLAEFTFGLPRHILTFTNKRLVMEERFTLLGVCGKGLQRTIQYRHIVDVGIGPTNKTGVLVWAAATCTLAILTYAILRAFGATRPAITILVTCLLWAACALTYTFMVDHFMEGVNLKVETCRGWNRGGVWPQALYSPMAEVHVVRLPAADATQAMNTLLQHPAVSIWCDREMV